MNKEENVKRPLMRFEYEALSLLLHFWAIKNSRPNRSKKWAIKLRRFRQAVIAGTRRGKHEKRIPRELVFAEYKNTIEVLKQLKGELKSYEHFKTKDSGALSLITIEYDAVYNDEEHEFSRPVPVPYEGAVGIVGEFLQKPRKRAEAARKIVAKRLGCSASKVKKNVASGLPKRYRPQMLHQILIGVFLDLCSLGPRADDCPLLAKILRILFVTRCPLLMIEYLLQNAQRSNRKLFVGEYDVVTLDQTCDEILNLTQQNNKIYFEPFVRLA